MSLGFFAIARAGLNSNPLSINDIEIFNFISGFLSEGFRRTLYVQPDDEDAAYLNGRGEVVCAGARICSVFKELFGERFREKPCKGLTKQSNIFAEHFRRFLNSSYTPGAGDLFLSSLGRRFHLVFSVIPFPDYRQLFPEVPQIKVILRKDDDCPESRDLLDFEKLDRKFSFTIQEKVIIRQIYRGQSNKDISIELKISEATVKHHIWNIFNKTGAENRTQLVFMLTG